MEILGPCGEGGRGQSSQANDTISCTCSVSFHRNHTATVRSQVENPAVSHVENEYSHPPRNSHISACPGEQRPMLPGMKAGGSTGHATAQRSDAPGGGRWGTLRLPFDSGHSRVRKGYGLNRPELSPRRP